jgi:sugar transferase (PEP-CTERM/EpsH1 system associated)
MGDILFLVHRIPFPPDRGDKIRSFHLLNALAGLGRVHLAAFADSDPDLGGLEALSPLVGRCHVERRTRSLPLAALAALRSGRPVSLAAFDSATMRGAVADILRRERIETIVAFSSQMAQFVPEDRGGRRFVMDFVDVDSAKFEAFAGRAALPLRWIHRREARLLSAYERQVARRADLSLFVSEAEAALFRQRSGLDRVAALENGIDLDFYRPDAVFARLERQASPLIVFTGQMDYAPNIDAVTGFARNVLPKVRAERPGTRFAIVGREPVGAVRRLEALPGVTVTGAVPDVRPWLAAADVVVAPLGLARGIQNKVLEAMAMARPVVASPAAFEGIDAEPGRELIVAEDGAEAIIALLADPVAAEALGQAARRRVEARYGWEARLAPLATMLGRAPARLGAAA